MTEERGALIEAMARAIADGIGDDFDHAHRSKPHWTETRGESGGRYRDINEPRQPDYLDAAQAALTAISNAGFAIVPVEPSEAMEEAARDVPFIAMGNGEYADPDRIDIYRAMIEAGRVK